MFGWLTNFGSSRVFSLVIAAGYLSFFLFAPGHISTERRIGTVLAVAGYLLNEEPFVCSGAHGSNDLWHFLCRFDRRSIVGLLYPGTTRNESRSISRAEIRITCHRPGRQNE